MQWSSWVHHLYCASLAVQWSSETTAMCTEICNNASTPGSLGCPVILTHLQPGKVMPAISGDTHWLHVEPGNGAFLRLLISTWLPKYKMFLGKRYDVHGACCVLAKPFKSSPKSECFSLVISPFWWQQDGPFLRTITYRGCISESLTVVYSSVVLSVLFAAQQTCTAAHYTALQLILIWW